MINPMAELDDVATYEKVVASLKNQLSVPLIEEIGRGNEFFVFQSNVAGERVVIKVPKDKVFSNVNDAFIDSQTLIDQEFALMQYLTSQGVSEIPQPIGILKAHGFGALVMPYVPSDDSTPDDYKLGAFLARIHAIMPPPLALSAQEGKEVPELITSRLARRWAELRHFVSDLPALPEAKQYMKILEDCRKQKYLLHMDFRQANFRMQSGTVTALFDWSNALIGPTTLELARVTETGEVSELFFKGYNASSPTPVDLDSVLATIFRLDTATMLALVFLSEEPDPSRARQTVARVRELHKLLLFRTV